MQTHCPQPFVRERCAAVLEVADGQIVDAVEKARVRKNTLFVFNNDNSGPQLVVTDNGKYRARGRRRMTNIADKNPEKLREQTVTLAGFTKQANPTNCVSRQKSTANCGLRSRITSLLPHQPALSTTGEL